MTRKKFAMVFAVMITVIFMVVSGVQANRDENKSDISVVATGPPITVVAGVNIISDYQNVNLLSMHPTANAAFGRNEKTADMIIKDAYLDALSQRAVLTPTYQSSLIWLV